MVSNTEFRKGKHYEHIARRSRSDNMMKIIKTIIATLILLAATLLVADKKIVPVLEPVHMLLIASGLIGFIAIRR